MNIKVLAIAVGMLVIGIGAGFYSGKHVTESKHSKRVVNHDMVTEELQAQMTATELGFLVRSLDLSQKRDYRASRFENCQLMQFKLRSLRHVKSSVFNSGEKKTIAKAKKKVAEIGCKS
jgi:hypothetical protein